MNPFQSIRSSITEKFPELPSFLNKGVNLFCHTHMCYNSIVQAYQPLDARVYGVAMFAVGELWAPAQVSLNLLLASKCVIDLWTRYRMLNDRYQALKYAIRGQYDPYHYIPLQKGNVSAHQNFFSPEFSYEFRLKILSFFDRAKRITFCFIDLMLELGKTSMCTMNVYLLCNGDRRARLEGYTELIASRDEYKIRLQEGVLLMKEQIVKGASSNLAIRILEGMGIQETEESLTSKMDALLKIGFVELQESFSGMQQAVGTIFKADGLQAISIKISSVEKPETDLHMQKFPPYGGQSIHLLKEDCPTGSTVSINEKMNLSLTNNFNSLNVTFNRSKESLEKVFSTPLKKLNGYVTGKQEENVNTKN